MSLWVLSVVGAYELGRRTAQVEAIFMAVDSALQQTRTANRLADSILTVLQPPP